MSRRNNNDAYTALGCLVILVAPFVFIYSKIQEMLTIPADDKMRNRDRPQEWGTKTEEVICGKCGAENESGRHYCYACNNPLPFKENPPLPSPPKVEIKKTLFGPINTFEIVLFSVGGILILGLLLMMFISALD